MRRLALLQEIYDTLPMSPSDVAIRIELTEGQLKDVEDAIEAYEEGTWPMQSTQER